MRLTYTKNKKRIKTYCNIIVKNKLMFSNGGIALAIENIDEIEVVGLLYQKNRPIASCIITKNTIMYLSNVAVFVKPKWRQMGYGRKILEYTSQAVDYKLFPCKHTTPARKLYANIK